MACSADLIHVQCQGGLLVWCCVCVCGGGGGGCFVDLDVTHVPKFTSLHCTVLCCCSKWTPVSCKPPSLALSVWPGLRPPVNCTMHCPSKPPPPAAANQQRPPVRQPLSRARPANGQDSALACVWRVNLSVIRYVTPLGLAYPDTFGRTMSLDNVLG